jgi:hypothetical protein
MSQALVKSTAAADAAALDRGDHRHARLVEAAEGVLQGVDMLAEALAGDVAIGLAAALADVGEHLQVHAGGEVLAGGGDDDAAGAGVVVDVPYDRRQLRPERLVHGVHRFGAFQLDVGDAVLDGDVEAGPGGGRGGVGVHGFSPRGYSHIVVR